MNNTFFKDHFYQLLGLQLLDKEALILGETYPFQSPEIALHLLRAWVKKIDIQLERPLEEVNFI